MFALIHRPSVLLKVDYTKRDKFIEAGVGQFQPFPDKLMNVPYRELPPEVLQDPKMLREWSRISIDIAHR